VKSIISFALTLLLAFSAAASDPCVEFLEQHLEDSGWEQKCIEWLASFGVSQQPSGAQSMESGAGAASATSSVRHLSASNLTLAENNQNEAFIAADPTSSRVFAISKTYPFENGLFAAYSMNHGTTWIPSKIAVGPNGSIPAGRADPWAVFGDTGRLFISYLHEPNVDDSAFGIPAGKIPTVVAKSEDGGVGFEFVEALEPNGFTDRGSMAIGPGGSVVGSGGSIAVGSLWVIYKDAIAGSIVVRGAALNASGDPITNFCGLGTGYFCVEQTIAENEVGQRIPRARRGWS